MGIQIQDVGGVARASKLIVNGVEAIMKWRYRLVAELSFAALVVKSNQKMPSFTRTALSSGVDRSVGNGSLIP